MASHDSQEHDAPIRAVRRRKLTVREQARRVPRATLAKIHVALYRWSGGKIAGHLPGWPEARIVLVDHTGAKSGVKRTSPLMYHEDGDTVAVVASKGGQPTHPAWFHNLRASPETAIQIGAVVREVCARFATDEERDRLWPKFVAFYPG